MVSGIQSRVGRGPGSGSGRRLALILLAGTIPLGCTMAPGGGGPSGGAASAGEAAPPGSGDAAAAGSAVSPGTRPGAPFPVRAASEVCPDAGYLCAGEALGEFQIHRWPDGTTHLTVRVPLPPELPRETGERLREAAVRGLLAWDGHPYRLHILARDVGFDTPAEVTVEWVPRLSDGRIGRVLTLWGHEGEELHFMVREFQLALSVGGPDARPLDPGEIRRVAAHEMGHALGLPHSDSPGDLMFPLNVAENLSPRDYRTLAALYALPNGTRVTFSDHSSR